MARAAAPQLANNADKLQCSVNGKSNCETIAANAYVVQRDALIDDIAKLLPIWPTDIDITSISERDRLLGVLRRALRKEHLRGVNGHWTYNFARHTGLVNLTHRLEARKAAPKPSKKKPKA